MEDGQNGQGPMAGPGTAVQLEGQILITLKEGQLSIQGPIDNPLLCYALLEGARDIVQMKAQEAHRKMAERGIIVPSMPMPVPGSPFGSRK